MRAGFGRATRQDEAGAVAWGMLSGAEHRVRVALDEHGLLPVQDARVPSVCTLVAGEIVRGSWWAHPAGHDIYDLLGRLADDCASVKLLWGKVTLVHRRLWPALAAVGEAGAPWQTDDLDDPARALLGAVRSAGELDSSVLGPGAGAVIDGLERRLLVISEQRHTAGGHHARRLRTWSRWLPDLSRPAVAEARAALEQAAASLGAERGLPW